MTALPASKPTLWGWQVAPSLRRATRRRPSHLPVFSSELALLSSLSAAFSGTDAGSELQVCRGSSRRGREERGGKLAEGKGGEFKKVWKFDNSVFGDNTRVMVLKRNEAREDGQEDRGEQNERDGWWRGGTHLLLWHSLALLLRGLLVLHAPQEGLALLCKSENSKNNSNFHLSIKK